MSALFQTIIFSIIPTVAIASLTKDNLHEKANGKPVFLKLYAPWCGHCKAMAPAWESLTDDYKDSDTLFVSKVDCTSTEGKELCSHLGVQGFPTIKYGDPHSLEDYKGGRNLEALQAHAKTIKMTCSPSRREECTSEEADKIDELLKLPKLEVAQMVTEKEGLIAQVEEEFKTAVSFLQETYNNLSKTKEEKIAEINQSGLKILKTVLAQMQ